MKTSSASATSSTYDTALSDSRKARWHPIDTIPTDRKVIVGRRSKTDGWMMLQFQMDANSIERPCIGGPKATHWAEDILGQPDLN